MAIAHVQSTKAQVSSGSSSTNATFSSTQTAGNMNVVVITAGLGSSQAPTVSSVVDTAGNTYTANGSVTNSNNASCWLYYCGNIAGGASNKVTVTLSLSPTFGISMAILEYSGISVAVTDGSATTGTGNSTTPSSGTLNTANATDLIIGAFGGGTITTVTAGSGYTLRQSYTGSGGPVLGAEDQFPTATGSFTGGFTLGTANAYAAICAAFKTGVTYLNETVRILG